jgi:mono/diheme cytochrome c family protein
MFRFLSLPKSGIRFFAAPALVGISIAAVASAQAPAGAQPRQTASAPRVVSPTPAPATGLTGPAARGEYLATNVAMCVECHSPRDAQGNLVSGELFLGAPIPLTNPPAGWATLAPKIARLPGSWTEEEVIRLLQTGQTRNGIPLRRPMPPFRLSREDATAIAAFLKSVSSTK